MDKTQIINELLKVPSYKYQTSECNKVLCSRLIATLEQIGVKGKRIADFLETQTKSSRISTKKRALRLLKKIKKE